jgi:imidazolonepropionase-like amidohydrolase
MLRRGFCVLVMVLGSLCADARELALVGATVYTDPDSPAIEDAVVVVRDGIIASVGARERATIPPDARVIDCAGAFITAGFWNSHVHILTPGLLEAATASAAALDGELDAMLNRWGFTTVFDVASVLANTRELRRRIDAGDVRGPLVLTVGEPVWSQVPSYVRAYLEQNRIEMPPVTTAPDAVRHVRSLGAQSADGVKLFTGSVQGASVAHLPLEIARAAVAEATRLDMPVFAHAQDAEGFEVALEAGVDVLTHPTPGTAPWSTALVSRLRRAGIALIPTLTLYDFESRRDGYSDAAREQLVSRIVADVRAFSAGGGEILFGTDVGYTDHFDTVLELRLLERAGLDHRRILASLTTNPARRFGFGRQSGRVRRGFAGDLVVLDTDPARDVASFARLRYTIRGGEIIYSAR